MPSPFPGMDPYLETPTRWGGFHAALISALREQLAPLVRPRFFVDSEDQVYLLLPADPEFGSLRPDVALVEVGSGPVGVVERPARIAAPLTVALPRPAYVTYQRLVIRDVVERHVIATIEVVSPANKRSGHPAHRRFSAKRARLFQADLHWIEIDLVRAGERPPELVGRGPYVAALHRSGQDMLEVWPMALRRPLLTIGVPLIDDLPDVPLDLNAAVTTVYERFGYDLAINYDTDPPAPPLDAADLAWARARVAAWREA